MGRSLRPAVARVLDDPSFRTAAASAADVGGAGGAGGAPRADVEAELAALAG